MHFKVVLLKTAVCTYISSFGERTEIGGAYTLFCGGTYAQNFRVHFLVRSLNCLVGYLFK